MKLSTEEILEKIEELKYMGELEEFISSLDLTSEQMELLANHENEAVRYGLARNPKLINEKVMIKLSSDESAWVRYWLAKNPNLTEELMIKLSCDVDWTISRKAFIRFKSLNSLKKEELEKAYDLIMKSKYISRENFKKTFDFIIDKFPKLSKLAKMFKRIILKGKKDLK